MTTPDSERVNVNTRALVQKVLSRYPEDFAVFRELLQNADDADATEAQIEFQTSDHAMHSAGASSNTNENKGTIPDFNTIKLSKWVIRNNGKRFESQDWNRLMMIGDGNPFAQKIGAFGVGFYSVFSVTDRPLVVSGGKSLSMFFSGDELCTKDATCLDDEWTLIEMELKEDVRGSVPKPFDLARFLAATMTFMSNLNTMTVFFDGNVILKIVKSRKELGSIDIPPIMKSTSERKTVTIATVSVATQEIIVNITDWALAAGTKRPSTQRSHGDDVPNDFIGEDFWNSSERSGNETPKVIPPSRASTLEEHTQTATYTIYSAEVGTNPSDGLRKDLNAMTKKDLPSSFRFEMAYFSKEQHDERAAEEKSDTIGSVFRGPQGLFPQLDCDREYMSRIFIGQSTAQTTGIGGHLSGLFIPTVERGSIDLTNCHIAKWNEELLYVGGFLARLAYETEINKIWSTWPKDEPTNSSASSSSRDDALYVMRHFSFHTSTPDDKVSKILRDAFFDCSNSNCFPILSNSGIHYTKDIRQPRRDFSSFMKGRPVLLSTEPGNSPRLIAIIPDRYKVPGYKLSDVMDELNGRILQEDETVGFLQWSIATHHEALKFQAELNDETKPKVTAQLKEVAKFYIGDREVAFRSISKFVDSKVWLPWLRSDDPLPPDTIPFSFTNTLNQNEIPLTLGWQPMTVVDWLRHLINPQIDKAHDIRRSETYSNRVLGILVNIWGVLRSNMKSEIRELMKDVSWIMTNKGFRRADDAYFSGTDNSPIVITNDDYQVRIVLTGFGVKDYHQVPAPLERLRELSARNVVEYFWLALRARDTRLEDVQKQAVFPCKNGGRYCSTELYIPHNDILELDLPILDWHKAVDADEGEILIWLGFLWHPPLDKIIEIAGSNDPNTRRAAFNYLSKHFDEVYESKYSLSKHEGKAFIPATKDGNEGVGAHKDVYSDKSWAVMGFWIIPPSFDSRMKGRLQIRESPTPKRLIEVFRERAPTDHSTATKWFAFLATNPGLTPDDIQEVAKFHIVPIGDQHSTRMVLPRECFLSRSEYPDDHHYQRIFTLVDFGEHGNKFLKACGAKYKPDCSDIADMLIKDPDGFFAKTNSEGVQGPDRYLAELRSVAVGYDRLSDEQKKAMKQTPMFIGYRGLGNYEPKLVRASEIMIADDMENRRIFGDLVLLAPRDELLEKLYGLMGSEDLSSHIKYDVTPIQPDMNKWPGCEIIRKTIFRKLPIFLDGLDKQRLKNPPIHLRKSSFLVRYCADLKVERRLDPQQPETKSGCPVSAEITEHTDPQQPETKSGCPVSAEITRNTDPSVILWLKKVDPVNMHDVAAALCRRLLKTYKKHDVLDLMIILETDKNDLKGRGFNVDWNSKTRKPAAIEGKRQIIEEALTQVQPNDQQCDGSARSPSGPSNWGIQEDPRPLVQLKPHESLVNEVVKRLTGAGAIPDSQEIKNRGHKGVGNKSKDAKYCTDQEYNHLVQDNGVTGPIKVWKHKTAHVVIPLDNLEKFQVIICDLCGVFEADIEFFNIFWYPGNPELMGFNRNRLIFLNLAHYTSKHAALKPGEAYIEWYQIIVHEIAHHEAPFHDERHELIVSGLSSRFLQSFHSKVKAVREYFECVVVSS